MRSALAALIASLLMLTGVEPVQPQLSGDDEAPVRARPLRGLRAEAATLLIQGQPGGSLPVALFVAAPDQRGQILLVAEIAGDAWPEVASPETDGAPTIAEATASGSDSDPAARKLEVLAYVVDQDNAVLAHMQEVIEIDQGFVLPADRDGLRYVGELALPAGYEASDGDSVL